MARTPESVKAQGAWVSFVAYLLNGKLRPCRSVRLSRAIPHQNSSPFAAASSTENLSEGDSNRQSERCVRSTAKNLNALEESCAYGGGSDHYRRSFLG